MKKYIFLSLLAVLFIVHSCADSKAQNTQLNASEFAAKIKELSSVNIIDVRTAEEFARGHLINAQNIDWNGDDFDQKIAKIDKSKPVFVYCLAGGRSSSAVAHMKKNGFKKVYELKGGMLQWRAAQLPETTENSSIKLNGMSRPDYDKIIKSDKIVLIDFYADWCGPCKKMKPYLDEIADEMKATVQVIRINADDNKALCQDLSVEALPTIFVYKKGKMMWYNTGYVEKATVLQYLK